MIIKIKHARLVKKFYFTIAGNNGNPVATSKMYKRYSSALRTAMKLGFKIKTVKPK